MNTGEKLWDLPIGQTPERLTEHPLLQGIDIPPTGGTGNSIQMVVGDLLLQTTEDLRGDTEVGASGMPLLHARDKRTGQILASIELPAPGQYGMMTYMHAGRQYVVVQAGSAKRGQPGQLVALRRR
jgi:quinoprotein glucose dehydrogenase